MSILPCFAEISQLLRHVLAWERFDLLCLGLPAMIDDMIGLIKIESRYVDTRNDNIGS
jgi:hypothetical protein